MSIIALTIKSCSFVFYLPTFPYLLFFFNIVAYFHIMFPPLKNYKNILTQQTLTLKVENKANITTYLAFNFLKCQLLICVAKKSL